jgi:hypothetical protein
MIGKVKKQGGSTSQIFKEQKEHFSELARFLGP